MTTLQIRPIGNSLGVILPAEILSRLRVSKGDTLYLTESSTGLTISALNPEQLTILDAAEVVMKKNRDILSKLAQ